MKKIATNDKEPCVIYARFSSHNQKEASIEQQISEALSYISDMPLYVVETYEDRALTGKTDKRPSFQKMMHDAERGLFKYVIAWKSNRMGRNMLQAMVNEARLNELGIRCLYVQEDFDDSAAGRFALRSMMNVNQFYSENMAEDIIRGMRDNAMKCLVTNGRLPLGYKKGKDMKYEIDEPRAKVVREIFTRVANGESYADIADSLNSRGLKTSYGAPFNKSSFQGLIHNERYKGIYIFKDIRIEGGVPRIISDELFDMVQEVSGKKKVKGRHSVNGNFILTGKIFCGICKSHMVGISGTGKNGGKHFYYACQGKRVHHNCSKKNIGKQEIEDLVIKAIIDYALTPEVIDWIAESTAAYNERKEEEAHLDVLEDELSEVNKGLANISKAVESGFISTTLQQRMIELEGRQTEIRRKIAVARSNIITIDKDELKAGLKMFCNGDVNDEKFRIKLIETFLVAVYVFEDRIKLIFSFTGNNNTIDIPLESIVDGDSSEDSVRLNSSLPHLSRLSRTHFTMCFVGRFAVMTIKN